jgi:hypothetical protein
MQGSLKITDIRVEKLSPNPWNPNRMSEPMKHKLREYIKKEGFVEPIVVRPGHRDCDRSPWHRGVRSEAGRTRDRKERKMTQDVLPNNSGCPWVPPYYYIAELCDSLCCGKLMIINKIHPGISH